MANPGFDGPEDPRFAGIAEAMTAANGVVSRAAAALGMARATLVNRLKAMEKIDPAVEAGMAAVGTKMVPVSMWVKTKAKGDEPGYSMFLRPATKDESETPEDILDRIADRLNRVMPAPAVKRPPAARSDLRNFIPLPDVHLSMRIGSYGTAAAVERLRNGTRDIVERSPSAECTILLNLGDFTENNDPSNQTPQSKHPLAVDAEYDDTTDVAVDVTAEMIETALTKSSHVIYKAMRGNHDPHTARILRAALRERYRKNPRVTIETEGIEFFAHEWAGNLICGFHGDIKRNIKDIVLGFADTYADEFARTKRCREIWYGHEHNSLMQDITGWRTIRLRAICPGGRYSTQNLFRAPSEMIGVTYKAGGGRFGGVDHGFDPLEPFN